MAQARALSNWKIQLKEEWSKMEIGQVDVQVDDGTKLAQLSDKQPQLEVGSQLKITANVKLGQIKPEDIAVQIYHGPVDSWGNISDGVAVEMAYQSNGQPQGECVFAGSIPCSSSGKHSFALRILPKHQDMADPYEPGMILWEPATGQK